MRIVLGLVAVVMGLAATACEMPGWCRETAECRAREGIPNALAKLRAGQEVRIAYFGGSITEARNGWREKTLAWFRSEFPQAKVVEINAAISGTGSDYGAIRLVSDVLAKKPDLVFVEFRVNGCANFPYQTAEGIVRQTRVKSPETDVCFVYTISKHLLGSLAAGRQTEFGAVMEHVCDRYGLPSIDFAPEIVNRLKDPSTFVFEPTKNALSAEAIQMDDRAKKAATDPDRGKLVFAQDGVHPGAAGHDIYRDVVARSMKNLIFPVSVKSGPHALPRRLCPNSWMETTTVPAKAVLTGPDWTPIADPRKDPVYGDTYGRTERMLRGGCATTKSGATFRIRWTGNALGFSDIPQAKKGEKPIVISVSVDGGKPFTWRRVRSAESRIYSRFVYLPELEWGEHEAVFTVVDVPAGQRCILGQFLVVGKPAL